MLSHDTPESVKQVVTSGSKSKTQGLGDTIAKITKAVGLEPCGGCKKRQKWLNDKFPYKQGEQP